MKAKFDMAKLQASLKKAAKGFGDSNKQATARWGVQTCRELAVGTQVHGKAGAKQKQTAAIAKGARAAVHGVASVEFRQIKTGKRTRIASGGVWRRVTPSDLLEDESRIEAFIEAHRGRNGHVTKLPWQARGIANEATLRKVIKARQARAGIAKGGWLGAGMAIAAHQRGTDRINIGKNFLGYAQKHAALGTARPALDPFKAIAKLMNRARHTTSSYVMPRTAVTSAIQWGLKKTLSWYRAAARRALDRA